MAASIRAAHPSRLIDSEVRASGALHRAQGILPGDRGCRGALEESDRSDLGDRQILDDGSCCRSLLGVAGLVPSESSTGEHVKHGGITKAGNSRARRMLIDGAWAYRSPRG